VSKGQTGVALSVRSKGAIFLNFELSTEEGQARVEGLGCCIFARNCKNQVDPNFLEAWPLWRAIWKGGGVVCQG